MKFYDNFEFGCDKCVDDSYLTRCHDCGAVSARDKCGKCRKPDFIPYSEKEVIIVNMRHKKEKPMPRCVIC